MMGVEEFRDGYEIFSVLLFTSCLPLLKVDILPVLKIYRTFYQKILMKARLFLHFTLLSKKRIF